MTNKSFFYKKNSHVSNEVKHQCRCEDVMDRMNEEIENLKKLQHLKLGPSNMRVKVNQFKQVLIYYL